jgi:hypothetical protein
MDTIPQPMRQALIEALEPDVSRRLSAVELRERLTKAVEESAPLPPQLLLVTKRLNYRLEDQDAPEVVLANRGDSDLQGSLKASVPWMQVPKQFVCAPRQECMLPVQIDIGRLAAGQAARGTITVQVRGREVASLPVRVEVPPPLVAISPMKIDLGDVLRRQVLTQRKEFRVENIGQSRALCEIEQKADWLVMAPNRFICLPGESQTIELAGRGDLTASRGDNLRTVVLVRKEDGSLREVEVSLGERGGESSPWGVARIGFAILFLLAAILWIVFYVLPMIASPAFIR